MGLQPTGGAFIPGEDKIGSFQEFPVHLGPVRKEGGQFSGFSVANVKVRDLRKVKWLPGNKHIHTMTADLIKLIRSEQQFSEDHFISGSN